MPSDWRNSIMATGLIFSLFDIASARVVPFGIPQYVQCVKSVNLVNAIFRDLPVSSFVFHSSLLTVKSVNLVVARDGFL